MSASTELAVGELTTLRMGPKRSAVLRRVVRQPSGLIGLTITAVMVGTAVFAPRVATSSPYLPVDRELLAPSRVYPMGTNALGRDMFSCVVYGIRTSMLVVAWVVLISSLIGVIVGSLAGYRGGWLDDLLMRLAELFQVVPRFFLALMVAALFGPQIRNLILLLGLTSWPLLAKVVRAESLALRHRGFVEAAESLGATGSSLLLRHILPNVMPAALVVIALTASRVVLIEATLRFLGLGDQTSVSLGSLASDSQAYLEIAWWMTVFPGVAIVAAGVGPSLLADGLNQAFNPRLPSASTRSRRRRRSHRPTPILENE